MKVFIDSNGCTLGQLESKRVEAFLESNDQTIVLTSEPAEADIIIFYACALTDVSEKASLEFITRLQSQRKPSSRMIVWGCLPKMNPQSLSSIYDGPLIGPRDIAYFNELVDDRRSNCEDLWANTLSRSSADDRYCGFLPRNFVNDKILTPVVRGLSALESHGRADDDLFYLRVAAGCKGHCTYCSERLAWGRMKSRPIGDVIAEYRSGRQKGYKRFFLCAEDLGPYGQDIGATIIDLLTELIRDDASGDSSLILDQFNPEYLAPNLEQLLEIFASGKIELFNAQVQSGSDRILEKMGREYQAGPWREAMLTINKDSPELRLGTHLIVGFPGETEEDFQETLDLLDYPLRLRAISVYMFSAKSKAAAARMAGQVPEAVKRSRYVRLWRKYLSMYSFHSTIGRLVSR